MSARRIIPRLWRGAGLRGCPQRPLSAAAPSASAGGVHAAAHREAEVLRALRERVTEPVSRKDLVSVGSVQHARVSPDGDVVLTLDLLTGRHPDEEQIVSDCKNAISEQLPWARSVEVHVSRRPPRNAFARRDSALARVRHVVAVSSCKGGVGKSTVAVNLALSMAAHGQRVGLLDADVYGPSLPFMLIPDSYDVKRSAVNEKWVQPLLSHGLRCMSFGWVSPSAGVAGAGGREAAVMRGPMASKVLNQLLLMTEWGELDFLVVDMPPGTGDLQMTLTQSASLAGAVLVTTPHTLSVADLVKGVSMFKDLNVPSLAVVENMAYFRCDAGKKYNLFGPSGERHLRRSVAAIAGGSAAAGMPEGLLACPHFSLPVLRGPDTAAEEHREGVESEPEPDPFTGIDIALPAVLRAPRGEEAAVFAALADEVSRQVLRAEIEAQMVPSVTYVKNKGILLRYFTSSSAVEHLIPAGELRLRDPRTGLPRADFHGRPLVTEDHVEPVTVEPKGAYGVAVVWGDAGRTSDIYTYDALRLVALSLANKGA